MNSNICKRCYSFLLLGNYSLTVFEDTFQRSAFKSALWTCKDIAHDPISTHFLFNVVSEGVVVWYSSTRSVVLWIDWQLLKRNVYSLIWRLLLSNLHFLRLSLSSINLRVWRIYEDVNYLWLFGYFGVHCDLYLFFFG